MEILICLICGYLIGTLSPAALLSKIKKKDLREHGTGNLGGTNALITFGKLAGAFVMIFDIAKAFFAVKLAEYVLPDVELIGMIAGAAAVIGHVFPFYLRFKGGKGVATLGGMVLAYNMWMFLILLFVGIALMFITNRSIALPISAAILFPILSGLYSRSIGVALIALAVGALIIFKHRRNISDVIHGRDVKLLDFLKSKSSR